MKSSEIGNGISRRTFFRVFGGGIFIFFSTRDFSELLAVPSAPQQQRRQLPTDFNAFLRIGEDGSVTGFTGKIEMGQGPVTSLAQMLADELDVSYDKVSVIMGDTDLCPYDMGTFGSLTTRVFGIPFREAAAEARAVLLELASEQLKIPVDRLEVNEGIVSEKNNGTKKISYADLAKGKRIERHLDPKPKMKDHTRMKIMGKSYTRRDSLLKVTGRAKYAGDFVMPGMLYARILRPPSHGARLISADTSSAEKIEGIIVIREGEMVAVLHELPDRASEALAMVKAEYSLDEKQVDDKSIFDYLLQHDPGNTIVAETGDMATGKSGSKTVTEEKYLNSYVAHAPIETHTAVAYMEGEKMMVRASTQSPYSGQEDIARASGMKLENVRVITPFVGGGFGGKNANQQMVEAARLAKLTGKPVMVTWTRREEFFYDTFRPAAVVKITSGTDDKGKIVLWDYHVFFAGDRGADAFYDIPNKQTVAHGRGWTAPDVHPFATGPWRAPGNNTNVFARECQIEYMASRAGIDPLEFRLMNLKDEKMIGVLKAVAEKFGYTPAKGPSGRGFGIACGIDAGTYVAHMAEVKVNKSTGRVEVIRVACAQDMGFCVNPEGASIQIEGCITMGLGYALSEEVRFTGGNIASTNFDNYELPRFSIVPKIDTVILDRPDQPPQGGGEPAIICMGGVIANAIFDATGARLLQLPMTPLRVREAVSNLSY
ncbi:MAG TPA: molybdopterin cofactor-binding domain-containing protein [Bacteroidales bacterium]|nr:molybdopterin cofactor-binding domain-containing protein [Bacteroidales bacterium]